MPDSLQKVIANFTGITRNDSLHGKEYLVAPAIMIVEGVLNGSEGPLLYPADELRKSVSLWNLKPAVLYHPQKDGAGISACSPEVLNTRGLGMMLNTRVGEVVVDDKKLPALKTEVWLDMAQVEKVDKRVLEAVENKEVMELSTGLLTDNEMTEGEWGGVHYDAIARNYRPDHLAILPDQKGACSIEDGAGFLRLNKAGKTLTISTEGWSPELLAFIESDPDCKRRVANIAFDVFQGNEMSDEDTRQLLSSLLRDKFPDEDYGPYVESIFSEDEYLVYEKDGKFYKQEFSESKGVFKFVGIPIAVMKDVNWIAIVNQKDKIMAKKTKKKIVDGLIENKNTQWTEDNRVWLMTQDEDVLDNMNPIASEPTLNEEDTKILAAAKAVIKKKAEEEVTKNKQKGKDVPVVNAEPETPESFLKKAPPEIAAMLQNGMDSYNADKKRHINIIAANDRCNFSEEQLEKKDLNELRQLAALATTTDNQREELATFNYGGQGETVQNKIEEEPLPLPAMNFEKTEAAKTN